MSIFSDNTGFTPVPGFNFLLRVEMAFDVPVKSVRAFTKNFEYEYIQEGGLNDYVHMRRKPISQPFTLEIERYAATDLYYDPLQNGTELMLPLLLMVSPYQGNFAGYSRRVFVFTGCTVTGKEYGSLDAERSALLTEIIKIAYRQVAVIDIPESMAAEKLDYVNGLNHTNEKLNEAKYGRQYDDGPYKDLIERNKKNGNANEAIIIKESDSTKKIKGVMDPNDKTITTRALTHRTGEIGKKGENKNDERFIDTEHGKSFKEASNKPLRAHKYFNYIDGETKAGNTNEAIIIEENNASKTSKKLEGNTAPIRALKHKTGEIGSKPEVVKYNIKSEKDAKKGNTDPLRAHKYFNYIDGETKAGNANEAIIIDSNKKITGVMDPNDKTKTITTRALTHRTGEKGTSITSNAAAFIKEGEKFTGKKDPVRAHSTYNYIEKEVGAAPDANKRSYPATQSYYGKETAEKYKSSAKNNARSWPKTESYYGKDVMENISKKAKQNVRKWPPTESAFGINQIKNNSKGKK